MPFSNSKKSFSINHTLSLMVILFFTFPVSAVQPMSEYDLETVSATTGSNILNIFGASQAGLTIDGSDEENSAISSVKLEPEQFSEGEATKTIALKELDSIEEGALDQTNSIPELTISNDTQEQLLKVNERTQGTASAFTTTSEVNYQTNNVHHEMREIEGGGIVVSRDLHIDLLKLENLRGANFDENRSAGNIYLSDWRSQGDTRIMTTK